MSHVVQLKEEWLKIGLHLFATLLKPHPVGQPRVSLTLSVRPLLVGSSVIVIFYAIFLVRYAVMIYYSLFWKKKIFFPIKRKHAVNNCFKLLISSVFTTAAARLKSEQKEKEKQILKLNKTRFKLINP